MTATDTTTINHNITAILPIDTTAAYDAEGAMKFTIAVVLVFGIGVIGLLGIYHCRSLTEDLSDKEADKFVKRFERKRCNLEKQYRKNIMLGLVSSIIARTMRAEVSTSSGSRSIITSTVREDVRLHFIIVRAARVRSRSIITSTVREDVRSHFIVVRTARGEVTYHHHQHCARGCEVTFHRRQNSAR